MMGSIQKHGPQMKKGKKVPKLDLSKVKPDSDDDDEDEDEDDAQNEKKHS